MRNAIVFFLVWAGSGYAAAVPGGTFRVGISDYPSQLLFYLGFDQYSEAITQLFAEPLLELDPETQAPVPAVAERWTRSKDRLTTTFFLNAKATFSDGKPVTASDVCFTFDALINPANHTAAFRSYFSLLESCKIVSANVVQFHAKSFHFGTLAHFADLVILPKHLYANAAFNSAFTTAGVGSGPYIVSNVTHGDRVTLTRNPSYWGADQKRNKGRYNFDAIQFKVVSDFSLQFEMFQKGELDYYYFLSSKMWSTETNSDAFKKGYLQKLKVENKIPHATVGNVWNLRRPLFQDTRVRHALALLFNRQRMIDTLFYKNYSLSSGVLPVNSVYHSPKVKPVPFDPKVAGKLLDEAGWTFRDSDGIRMKDNKRFEFTFLTDSTASHRYLTVYQEDLLSAGIKANIQTLDRVTVSRRIAERDFDSVETARDREIEPSDFNVMWGSEEAKLPGSGNVSGFASTELDALDAKLRVTEDARKRIAIVRRIDEIISESHAIAFAWEQTYTRIGYWNRYSFPKKGYFNYSKWNTLFQYWYLDPVKEAKLKQAMEKGQSVL